MPYNLRKRKAPEPIEIIKKPRAKAESKKQDIEPVKKTARRTKKQKELETQSLEEEQKVTGPDELQINQIKLIEKEDEPPRKKIAKTKIKAIEKDVIDHKPIEVKQSRRQWVFGNDGCGELGLGKIGFTKKNPTCVPIDEPIRQVACGPMHTITLTEAGQVLSYGCNDEGALGRVTDGDSDLEAKPTLVPIPNIVQKISAGDSHSAALTDKQEVYVWGNFRDEHGSIGLTPECNGQSCFKPLKLMPETKFTDIASGSNHMLLLDNEGIVYSFGVGAQGQLGRLSPEEVGESNTSYPITAENRHLFLNPHKVSLKEVDPQRPFICDAIFAGNNSSFATNTDKKKNRLAGWGLNNYHQLGYKGKKDELVQHRPRRSTFTCSTSMRMVACGQHHTLFLTKTGRVFSAGRHDYGMLGLGKVDKEVCPAKNVDGLSVPISNIDAGINTSFAVGEDGKLYAWGMSGPQLGVQSEEDLTTPTEVKSLENKKVISVSTEGEFTSVIIES